MDQVFIGAFAIFVFIALALLAAGLYLKAAVVAALALLAFGLAAFAHSVRRDRRRPS